MHSTLFAIRGLYRDLAEWAHDDPVPCQNLEAAPTTCMFALEQPRR
jgi:hypothetical protein